MTIKPWTKYLIIFAAWLVLAMILSASPVRQALRFPTDINTPVY